MGKTILTESQRNLLDILVKEQNFFATFFLTGGTALAEYYLQHRLSEDLDFFNGKEIDDLWLTTLTKKLKTSLRARSIDSQKSFNRNLVFISFGEEIVKTEFTYFPFTNIEKPRDINGVRVDSLLDIAVNKFFAVYQKPEARHFIDLYLMLTRGFVTWDKLASLARIKFDTVIDPLQLGTSFMQAKEVTGLPHMLVSLHESSWRDFFCNKAMELKSEIKK